MSHLVQGLLLEGELFPAGYGVCWSLSLAVSFMWLIGLSSGVIQSPPLVVLALGPLGLGSSAGRLKMLCITVLGLPVWSYHVILCLWPRLLGLGVCGGTGLCTRIGFLKL